MLNILNSERDWIPVSTLNEQTVSIHTRKLLGLCTDTYSALCIFDSHNIIPGTSTFVFGTDGNVFAKYCDNKKHITFRDGITDFLRKINVDISVGNGGLHYMQAQIDKRDYWMLSKGTYIIKEGQWFMYIVNKLSFSILKRK